MIPTINQILSDFSTGSIPQQEALRLIDEHLRLDRNEALELAAKHLDDNWYKTQSDCAAAIRKLKVTE